MYSTVHRAGPLPRGRHDLPRETIEADQLHRLFNAMAEALAEHGYSCVTVAHVIERAGVSRRIFYEYFESKEVCILAAYDDAERRLWNRAAARRRRSIIPAVSMRGLRAALGFFAAEPAAARLFTMEARAAGPELVARHRSTQKFLAELLQAGPRRKAPRPRYTRRPSPRWWQVSPRSSTPISPTVMRRSFPSLSRSSVDYLLAPYSARPAETRHISSVAA